VHILGPRIPIFARSCVQRGQLRHDGVLIEGLGIQPYGTEPLLNQNWAEACTPSLQPAVPAREHLDLQALCNQAVGWG
jgi:hypothetical protein